MGYFGVGWWILDLGIGSLNLGSLYVGSWTSIAGHWTSIADFDRDHDHDCDCDHDHDHDCDYGHGSSRTWPLVYEIDFMVFYARMDDF